MSNIDSSGNILGAISIIVATVILYIQNHRQNKRQLVTHRTAEEVKQSLTQNNGGSSVKDRLDSMDQRLHTIDSRWDTIDRRFFIIESLLLAGIHEKKEKGNDEN
jgi:hypothetical protein